MPQLIQSRNIEKEPTGFSNMEANLGEGCWQWKPMSRIKREWGGNRAPSADSNKSDCYREEQGGG